jgi:hypothetical protein
MYTSQSLHVTVITPGKIENRKHNRKQKASALNSVSKIQYTDAHRKRVREILVSGKAGSLILRPTSRDYARAPR